jgi:hypothetical protein
LTQASSSSKDMYAILSTGEWYKRLVVMTQGRDLREDAMERLRLIYSGVGKGAARESQWMRRLLLQLVLQRNIRDRVSALTDSERGTLVPGKDDSLSRFLAACNQEQLILVDFPDPERTLAGDLYYLVEEDYISRRVDASASFDSEASSIFRSISRDFTTSIGKLRILIKEEHREFVHRFLQRASIVSAMFEALDYVTSVQSPGDDELFRYLS